MGQFLLEAIVALNACYSTKNIGVQVLICPALSLPPFSFVELSFDVECVSISTFFQYLFIYFNWSRFIAFGDITYIGRCLLLACPSSPTTRQVAQISIFWLHTTDKDRVQMQASENLLVLTGDLHLYTFWIMASALQTFPVTLGECCSINACFSSLGSAIWLDLNMQNSWKGWWTKNAWMDVSHL